ncbi:MAG: hypothetical protein H7Y38_05785 [Armatimonadetes bacterium]|nr:hypothetical protein [Armatimonadota bacterium]
MIAAYPELLPETTGLPSPVGVELQSGTKPQLRFERDVRTDVADDRWTTDLADVAREPDTLRRARAEPVYTVYRRVLPGGGVSREIERHGLTYNLLVMRGGTLPGATEYVRNRGHANSVAPGTSLPYPEIHELLTGEAWLYLQHGTTDTPTDTVVIPLRAGQKAIIAPGFASLIVNVGDKPLVVGTWRMNDCETRHDELEALGGMAHFVLKGGDGKPFCEANERYKTVPVPRTALPHVLPDFGLSEGEPLLSAFHRSPESLRCLLRPQDFADTWKTLYD